MNFSSLVLLSLIGPVFILIIYIMARTLIRKQIPDSRYNPFDYITGQTVVQFQEQKEQKEEDDDQGDDKEKHAKKIEKRS